MQHRLVRTVVAAAVLCVGLGVSLAAPAGADTVSLSAPEAQFLNDINALRAQHGLQAVVPDSQLTNIARNWTIQMANAGTISHNPSLASEVTENWTKLGENVGYGPDVQSLFTAFVNSPHHYENLVDPSYNRIGIGVVVVNGTMYTTHDFEALAAPAPAPAPAVAPAPAPAPAPAAAPVARVAAAAAPLPPTPAAAPTAAPAATAASAAAPAASTSPAPAPSPAASELVAVQLQELRSLDSAA